MWQRPAAGPLPQRAFHSLSLKTLLPKPSRFCIACDALALDHFPRSIRRALRSVLFSLSVNACLSRIVLPYLTAQRLVAAPNDCRQIGFHPHSKIARRTLRHGGQSVVQQARGVGGGCARIEGNPTRAGCVASTNRRLVGAYRPSACFEADRSSSSSTTPAM